VQQIHELPDWPNFRWSLDALTQPLAAVRHEQGRLLGRMEALGFGLQQEAALQTLTADVLKTSEIEGEKFDVDQVRSSLARRLGIDIGALKPADRSVEGIVDVVLDATNNSHLPLTAERLFGWQAALFPTSRSGLHEITVGSWRKRTVQVISGPVGNENVHFEGPAASRLEHEMDAFLEWFNRGHRPHDPLLKAALAHLWLLTIHPFDDGNGRIARAIADMQLTRSENSPRRFYSMSAQIRQERTAYYEILERTQKGSLDITTWMLWFLECLGRAIEGAQAAVGAVLAKARFWESISAGLPVNDRQRLLLNRLLDGFEGKLTTAKWAKLAKCSHDTALRDIQALLARGVLVQDPGGGRSTSYSLRAG
jgi:Fic family protein